MTYRVLVLRRVQRELQHLPQEDYERVREAMRGLAHNPRPTGCLALTGRSGWRIRVGDYRVINEVDDVQHTVTMLHVGHRRDVYPCQAANLTTLDSLRAPRGCEH